MTACAICTTWPWSLLPCDRPSLACAGACSSSTWPLAARCTRTSRPAPRRMATPQRHHLRPTLPRHPDPAGLAPGQAVPQHATGRVNSIRHQGHQAGGAGICGRGTERTRWRARGDSPEAGARARLHRRHAMASRSSTSRGSDTLDDTAILNDFLAACEQAKAHPRPAARPAPSLRERAARRLRQALSRQRDWPERRCAGGRRQHRRQHVLQLCPQPAVRRVLLVAHMPDQVHGQAGASHWHRHMRQRRQGGAPHQRWSGGEQRSPPHKR